MSLYKFRTYFFSLGAIKVSFSILLLLCSRFFPKKVDFMLQKFKKKNQKI